MAIASFPGVRFDSSKTDEFLRQVATLFNNMLRGKLNMAVEFTPAAATTSTVVIDVRIGPQSILLIEATSSGGATELASGSMFIDSTDRGAGQCTVTHSTGAASNLFRMVILG